jgi:hypothetical protein
MNYIVKSAGNGVSQKNITIEIARKEYVLTVEGEVLVYDTYAEEGGIGYDVSDWEITELNGQTCNHAAVWESMKTLHSDNFTTVFGADIDAALIEVASDMVTAKTPQNAPEVATADFGSMTMDERILRIDWDAVKAVFEQDFDLRSALNEAINGVDSEEFTNISVDSGYGSRNFTVEVEFDGHALTREIADDIADSLYEFCDDQAKVNATATAA